VPLGDEIEIDVASLERPGNGAGAGGVATAVWSPPRPRLAAPVDFSRVRGVAIHVFQDSGGPQLRAAIELVSPAYKDRPRSRLTFAVKCVGYLERGVGLVVLDTVTTRRANMHAEIAAALETTAGLEWDSPTFLAGVAYRTAAEQGQTRISPGRSRSPSAPTCRRCRSGSEPNSACRCLWRGATPPPVAP
jgi:hypothetical protein